MWSPTRRARAPGRSIWSSPDSLYRMASARRRPALHNPMSAAHRASALLRPHRPKLNSDRRSKHATLQTSQRDPHSRRHGSLITRGCSMLTVRTGNASPFGRKIRIAVKVLGLEREVAIEPASTVDPADPIRQQNPLGKVPVLLLDDGTALYDSPVILEYLDHLAGGGRILPKDPQSRFAALRLQALADGLMDASILINYEARYRPVQNHEPKWLDLQAGQVTRALAVLEAAPPPAIP